MTYTDRDVVEIIRLITGKPITNEEILSLKGSIPKPTTIIELEDYPFKTDYPYLCRDMPKFIQNLVDGHLENGYKYSTLMLDDVIDEIYYMKNDYPMDDAEKQMVTEAEAWLVERTFGSMCLDW